jgi:RNA polymerase sigma factor (sigma-70 family)
MFFLKKEKQFRTIYNDCYSLVFRALCRRARSVEDAEDICHDLFAKLYNRLEEIKEPRAWLMKSLHNEMLYYYRSKGPDAHADIHEIEEAASLAAKSEDVDVQMILDEIISNDEIYADKDDKIIFEMVAFYNFSYNETAQQMDLSKRQVEYSYRKSAQRIIAELRKKGINELDDIL